jgi:V8-like Glu-specific endopeptidase
VGFIGGFVNKAYAITYGEPDGDEHPYVGVVVVHDDSGNFVTRGSGILMSPTVVLTAGHVTWVAENWFSNHWVRVSFVSDLSQIVEPPNYNDEDWKELSYAGTPHTHPDYYPDDRNFPNTCDIGVIELYEPVYMDNYGELPELGALDALATKRGHQDRIFTTVGYGYQSVRPVFQFDVVRYKATSMLVNLRSALTDGYNLHTSNNPGKGQGTGGSCFGDSGGPVFFDDTSVIAAIVSFGLNNNCKGADFGYRMDIPESQTFINSFLVQ